MRLTDYFDNAVKFYPNNTAFIDVDSEGSALTYQQAAPITHKFAAAIADNGYAKGSHVGILAPNSTIAFLALLGIYRSQSVWVPINPRNAVKSNIELLTQFDTDLLLYHSSYAREAEQIMAETPSIKEAVCIDGGAIVGRSFEDFSARSPDTYDDQPWDLDDTFAIFPTGGTTGKSKGVLITHRNVLAFCNNFFGHFNYYDDSCHLVVAPMTHTAGLTGCLHFPRGGTNAIMSAPVPGRVIDAIEQYRVTHLFLPPTVLYMLLDLPDVREKDYSSLRHFLIGAAPSSLEKLKEAIDVFGPVMTEAFGQSEAPAAVTAKAPWDYMDTDGVINDDRLRSIGRPCINNVVAILDDEGNEVDQGTPGEICIKGDLVTPGYYKNPEATAEVRTFGWHHTGDVGVMDSDGFVTIVDRKKDMIITGGFNVFPNEVEQVLTRHPAIMDCAVFGVPDKKWGEAVKAVVQLKKGSHVSEDELISLAKRDLGSVKAPKSVDFVDDLPRSPVGKVLKVELRKPYWDNQDRAVN